MAVVRVDGVAQVEDWEITSGLLTITPNAGADRFLLGGTSGMHLFSSAPTVSDFKYGGSGGTSMSALGAQFGIDSVLSNMRGYYAVGGPSSASDLYSLFTVQDPQRVQMSGLCYTGVDQATPYSDYTVNNPTGTGSVTTLVASVTVPNCVAGQTVCALVHGYLGGLDGTVPTAVAGTTLVAQALRTDAEQSMSAVAVLEKIAASNGPVTLEVNLNQTTAGTIAFGALGMRLNAAEAGPPPAASYHLGSDLIF